MELADFLLARIADDEAVARAAVPAPWTVERHDDTSDPRWSIGGPVPDGEKWAEEVVAVDSDRDYNNPLGGCGSAETATHIARHNPARVLAECDAKRRVVVANAALTFEPYVLCCLALPYADHPDYNEEWRP